MARLRSDKLLIEEARQRPVVYGQRLRVYRHRDLNDACLEISAELGQRRHIQSTAYVVYSSLNLILCT